jgi:hypothetical protein
VGAGAASSPSSGRRRSSWRSTRQRTHHRPSTPGVAGLQLRRPNSMPVSPPSPGKITEPVLRDVCSSVPSGRGRSVLACRLRFPYRALFCRVVHLSRGLDALPMRRRQVAAAHIRPSANRRGVGCRLRARIRIPLLSRRRRHVRLLGSWKPIPVARVWTRR